jgi:hypothetical protein
MARMGFEVSPTIILRSFVPHISPRN